jgi:uncharacterized protein
MIALSGGSGRVPKAGCGCIDAFPMTSWQSTPLENSDVRGQLAFQEKLGSEGILFAAGPLWIDDGQSWEGEAMSVIRAESLAEAEEIAARDPMHKGGARTFHVRRWLVNEGALTIQLSFARGRFKLG